MYLSYTLATFGACPKPFKHVFATVITAWSRFRNSTPSLKRGRSFFITDRCIYNVLNILCYTNDGRTVIVDVFPFVTKSFLRETVLTYCISPIISAGGLNPLYFCTCALLSIARLTACNSDAVFANRQLFYHGHEKRSVSFFYSWSFP